MKALRVALLCLVSLPIFLLSCKQPTNVADVRKEIEAADARQMQAFATKDMAGLTANYAADAMVLPQNGPMVSGRENREAFFKEMSNMVSGFKFSMSHFDASGDLAYEVGTYTGMMGPVSDTGKFVTVWKRQADGKWMIVADIFNTNLAPPAAAPPPPVEQKKKK
jgi:ketosteroid isomerase-like protein